ncbi:MAG: ImmA/IrrE family metallo-endopeptidase [Defluviitaleaceae bacterium]|nr:ImmA/IrrE family metallo-endopeptidase [Defluviitaleaceae bacterium]
MTVDMPFIFNRRLVISLNISIKEVEAMTKIVSRQDAEKKASQLYDEHFNPTDSIFRRSFATDLNTILQKMGISVVIQSLKEYEEITKKADVSGFLLKNGDEYAIFVEEGDSMERKRFTIAHEIAHKILNHIDETKFVNISFRDDYSSQGTSEEEIAANAFAAVLLMPEKIIRHVYTLTSDIAATARYMGVSDAAVRNRLNNLGIL